MTRTKKLVFAALLLALTVGPALADEGTDEYITLIRSDLQAEKKQLVADAMDLTDQEGAKFWPIYDAYETERVKLGDQMVDLIKKYPEAVNVTGTETIRMLAANWLKVQDDQVDLWKKYYKKAEKDLTPRIAARWMQVEYRI